jgi:putative component of membrane protein insertase Oxa1/YidC/SpoIIIJ protein YidD
MRKTAVEKLVFRTLVIGYQVFRALRYQFLYSAFGYVSKCKHQPSCGTYALRKIEQEGLIVGGAKGILRVLSCW